jgi:Protein of unknown function (DUF1592)/Protein of unknown function (DUF1588)/Protein of unknown function (DUF1585)/Protein of unknown function (DUF1595)
VVRWVEVDGPIHESWPPRSHERLYAGVKLEPIPGVRPNADPNAHLDGPPTIIAKPALTEVPELKAKQKLELQSLRVYDPQQTEGGEKVYRSARIREPLHPTLRLVSNQPRADAERLLRAFVPVAFRRPVTDAEIEPFLALTQRWLDAGVSLEQALRAAYKAVLVSPGFLYHQGGRAVGPGRIRLTNHELAERLAFSLWSSLPDAELLQAAAAGELTEPNRLRSQVERMLRDPRSERFLVNFLGQWLDQRLIDFTAPDSDLYPEFDDLLQWSMVEETKAFTRELLVDDLSVRNFVHSDFAMLNDRLAGHYGIAGVSGTELQRVRLPHGSVRGGVLTQASVLKVTANGTTTSPVIRGKWVNDRILGTPPEPPPPAVPAIEPDIRGSVTVRQQLQQHRNLKSCASCHRKIDPPGMALESFDVIGGWRDVYRVVDLVRTLKPVVNTPTAPPPPRYRNGLPVDAADVLPDGRRFGDIREFKQHLLADPDQIACALAAQLICYFTGAPPSFADRARIEQILDSTRAQDHGFRSLIQAVIQDEVFRIR